MKIIEKSITINAAVNKVWEELMNFDDYAQWNPFIRSISGIPTVGNQIQATMHLEGHRPATFKPMIIVNELEKEFRWEGHLFIKGLFDGEHYFKLESISNNETRFVQGEKFTGVLSGVLLKMIGDQTLRGFDKMNSALKYKIEK